MSFFYWSMPDSTSIHFRNLKVFRKRQNWLVLLCFSIAIHIHFFVLYIYIYFFVYIYIHVYTQYIIYIFCVLYTFCVHATQLRVWWYRIFGRQPPNYNFNIQVQNPHSGVDFTHQETRSGPHTRGGYRVALPDGRTQRVSYVVGGDSGFLADVGYDGTVVSGAPDRRNNEYSRN